MIHFNLREIRLSRNMSQLDLAWKMDINESYLASMERGESKVYSLSILDKYCKALNCQISDLLSYKEESNDSI